MAHFQNQYGAVPPTQRNQDPNRNRTTDEYGNPVMETDEHGIPVHHTGTTIETGIRDASTGLGGGHHRSGSSSSSSSSEEDDGQGGRRRRKKGLKEKIKGMLQQGVGHKDDRSSITAITTTPEGYNITGGGHQQQLHEKKGTMEKIKEKLPGGHHHHHHHH